MLGALAGYSFAYFARGLLAGRGQFPLYAALLLIEVPLRLAPVVLVTAEFLSGTLPVAIGIALAPLAGVVVVPSASAAPERSGRRSPARLSLPS